MRQKLNLESNRLKFDLTLNRKQMETFSWSHFGENSCNIKKIVILPSFLWMGMWLQSAIQIWDTTIILAANKDLAESKRISGRLIIDPIIWQSGEPKVSPGEHDRKQNVSGWQKHASDLVKAVLVAVVMETEVGGRAVTVPLVEVMSVWHVGSSECCTAMIRHHILNDMSY